jgi:ribosomal-protein-alanine N-acetyltransferase
MANTMNENLTKAPSPCQVRRMTPADVPQVSAIENAVFTLPWSMQSIAKQAINSNDHTLVAISMDDGSCHCGPDSQSTGSILGYALVWHIADEADIGNIAVAPSFHRRGIARRLLQAVIDDAIECKIKIIFLEVRTGNIEAINLYKSFGFAQYTTRKHLYELPDEDGILMKKELNL